MTNNFFNRLNANSDLRMENIKYYLKAGNEAVLGISLASFFIKFVLYSVAVLFICRISRLIKPCFESLIAGFNFIDSIVLSKLINYFEIQIAFFFHLDMLGCENAEKTYTPIKIEKSNFKRVKTEIIRKLNQNKNKVRKKRVRNDGGLRLIHFKLPRIFIGCICLAMILNFAVFVSDFLFRMYMTENIQARWIMRTKAMGLKLSATSLLVRGCTNSN